MRATAMRPTHPCARDPSRPRLAAPAHAPVVQPAPRFDQVSEENESQGWQLKEAAVPEMAPHFWRLFSIVAFGNGSRSFGGGEPRLSYPAPTRRLQREVAGSTRGWLHSVRLRAWFLSARAPELHRREGRQPAPPQRCSDRQHRLVELWGADARRQSGRVSETFIRDYFLQLVPGSTNRLRGWVQLDGAQLEQTLIISEFGAARARATMATR